MTFDITRSLKFLKRVIRRSFVLRRATSLASFAVVSMMLAADSAGAGKPADTLVVCPVEFRQALAPWVEYRRGQGHEIAVVAPSTSSTSLRAQVKRLSVGGGLKCLVLVGDVADGSVPASAISAAIPTNHIEAKINTRWGSTPTIASDVPYTDLDDDGTPELTIGRIPANSPDELGRVVAKIIRYERESQDGDWQRRLDIVAGIGGFGALADGLIEAAGRQVFQQAVPTGYELRHTSAKSANAESNLFRETACKHLNEGSLAWVYLGHGLPTELDRVPTPIGLMPILSVDDVPQVKCDQCRPLAVLVACYTGAFDGRRECLAEELVLSESGPVAVIAATRVTMPYGNTVFGYELLRACFNDRPTSLGEVLRLAQCRALTAVKEDRFRPSLDSLAQGLSPPPVDLAAERREHVMMYHLLGDPLLRLRLAPPTASATVKVPPPIVGTTAISK
jgi:hypothetical protein